MNDFREFSKAYNDYICHAASTGHMTKKGDKNLISTEDPKEPPKHYAYRLAQSGWTIDQVKQLCERSSNAYDSPANHKYWAEVLRIFKENYVQHSCNDFRQFSEQYKDYLMHSNGRPGKTVHKTFLYKGMTPQDYVDELLSSKTKEEAIQNLNNRLNNQSVSYNPQEKKFFIQCLKILQNK